MSQGGIYQGVHLSTYIPREAYTRVVPSYTHREAYTGCIPLLHTQGGIYPGITSYTHREAYTRVIPPGTHIGRHTPGLYLLLHIRRHTPGLYTRFTVGRKGDSLRRVLSFSPKECNTHTYTPYTPCTHPVHTRNIGRHTAYKGRLGRHIHHCWEAREAYTPLLGGMGRVLSPFSHG